MSLAIREARPDDREFLVRGNTEMARETEGLALDAALIGPGVEAVLADPSLGRYFVAELDGIAVGQLMVTYEWSDWRNGMFWWIQSVFVEPGHRGQGIFSALFRHVSDIAEGDAGICGLRLYVERTNRGAQSIYSHLGLHVSNYEIMERVFRGPESHREG